MIETKVKDFLNTFTVNNKFHVLSKQIKNKISHNTCNIKRTALYYT